MAAVKTKNKPVKSTNDKNLMHETISKLTDIVSQLEKDVKRIKLRLGL